MFLTELWDDIIKQREANGQPSTAKSAADRQKEKQDQRKSDIEKRKEEMKQRAHKNGQRPTPGGREEDEETSE